MKRRMALAGAAAALVASTIAAAAYPTNTTGATYLHTGPGAKYSLVTPVPAGARVDVQHCVAGWCRVVWTQYAGYMQAGLLASAPKSYPPVYAPPVGGYAPYPLACDPYFDSTCGGYYYGYPFVFEGYGGGFGHGWGHGWGHGGGIWRRR